MWYLQSDKKMIDMINNSKNNKEKKPTLKVSLFPC